MKVTVIGGGSTYTPELVHGFLDKIPRFPLDELCLMDVDVERLAIVGEFAKRMTRTAGNPFEVTLENDTRDALSGASYVITQVRVGKMRARREDEYLGRRHRLIGQETTGVGGMAKALRTIPIVLGVARDMRECSPEALLLNFTNPSGLVTEALSRYVPDVNSVGVCNVGITTKMRMLELYEKLTRERVDPERAALDTLGINHLTWHRGFLIDGKDVWSKLFPAILEDSDFLDAEHWDRHTLETLGMLPNSYLQYYYYTDRKLAEQETWPPSRAEEVMEIERNLLREYVDPNVTSLPPDLLRRGGAFYSELATRLILDHYANRGGVHIVNTLNAGAVPEWPPDWVLEMPARVDRSGIHPLPAKPLPPSQFSLLSSVKMYELLTVKAAAEGDREAAYKALLAHPLGPSADRAEEVLEDMLTTNRGYLPAFFSTAS